MGDRVLFALFFALLCSCAARGRAVLSVEAETEARASAPALDQPEPALAGAAGARMNLTQPAPELAPPHQADHSESAGRPAAHGGEGEVPTVMSADAGMMLGGAGAGGSAGMPNTASVAGGAGSSDVPPPAAKHSWRCTQIGRICECVQSTGNKVDACSIPKPTCCYALPDPANAKCVCVPNGGSECELLDTDPEAERVGACPL